MPKPPIPDDETAHLDASDVLRVQSVLGCIIYYTHEIETPLLPALTEIVSNQAKATEETLAATKRLLDFVATFPEAVIRYISSDMCLCIDSDTSFASIQNARIRVGGLFYLSAHPSKITKHHDPRLNVLIFVSVSNNENGPVVISRIRIRRNIHQRQGRSTNSHDATRTAPQSAKNGNSNQNRQLHSAQYCAQ